MLLELETGSGEFGVVYELSFFVVLFASHFVSFRETGDLPAVWFSGRNSFLGDLYPTVEGECRISCMSSSSLSDKRSSSKYSESEESIVSFSDCSVSSSVYFVLKEGKFLSSWMFSLYLLGCFSFIFFGGGSGCWI